MNKGILKKILIFSLIFIMIFSFNINYFIYAAGASGDDDPVDSPPSTSNPSTPDPVTPTPSTPDPITPTPSTPDPIIPTPSTPDPEPEPPKTYSISGNVWEDFKSEINAFNVMKGDGIYQEGEPLIDGITVKLFNENSNEPIKETTTTNGYYSFSDISDGKYKVEFTYGNNSSNLKYNGQDYKSTFTTLDVTPTTNTNTEITETNSPIDIVLLVDVSGSMSADFNGNNPPIDPSRLDIVKNSLQNFITTLKESYSDIRISLFAFSTYVYKISDFTNNFNDLSNYINNLNAYGFTSTLEALNESYDYIKTNARNESKKFLLIYTDGAPTLYTATSENDPSQREYINKTRQKWFNILTDSSINSFVIAAPSDDLLEYVFGNTSNTLHINNYSNITQNLLDSLVNFVTSTSTTSNNGTTENKSYATDSQARRLKVMEYSMNIDYDKATNLDYEHLTNADEFIRNTYMTAETPEFYVQGTDVSNINLALEERPRANVEVKKNVSHLKITLSDGRPLIDWMPEQTANNKTVKHLMVLPDSLTAIMDDEITHGALIQIEYSIYLENKSETDTLSNYFTREFLTNNPMNIPTELYNFLNLNQTTADIMNEPISTRYCLYDYINNNSIFDADNSSNGWSVVNNPINRSENVNSNSQTILENSLLSNQLYLKPKDSSDNKFKISTSKLMTIADTDLLTYDNYIEVVQYSSVLGRRMYKTIDGVRYNTIPGNLDIYDEERVQHLESDEAKAETVTRVPPFGKDLSYYTTLIGIFILAIEIVILSTLKFRIRKLRKKFIMK